jgi:hypothetical protein
VANSGNDDPAIGDLKHKMKYKSKPKELIGTNEDFSTGEAAFVPFEG